MSSGNDYIADMDELLNGKWSKKVKMRGSLGSCVWLSVHLTILYKSMPPESRRLMLLSMSKFVLSGDGMMDDFLRVMCSNVLNDASLVDDVMREFVESNPDFFKEKEEFVA